MRVLQYRSSDADVCVGVVRDLERIEVLTEPTSVRELASIADTSGEPLENVVRARLAGRYADYAELVAERRLLAPVHHPDPAHLILSGTGLNHTGSAMARDAMHGGGGAGAAEEVTDSIRMFRSGVAGGKPAPGRAGVAPEWFYKGDGTALVAPEQPLPLPGFAGDGGEEAELVALYLIGRDGRPRRIGYALGNEFSDHVVERENYLYLAASKMRACSIGPELLVGELPGTVEIEVRVVRDGDAIWSQRFKTGEANMTHSLANLEHHHFKYPAFRRPGDLHCHFLGTAALSFAAGVAAQTGDRFEIESVTFGRPLRNELGPREEDRLISVAPL